MIETIIFAILAALVVFPAIFVVTVKNVFHSALWLIVSLFGVAGIYAMLAADFLFAVQLLVYVGGVMVLLIFVVLLSGKPSDWTGRQTNEKTWLAALFSGFLVAAVGSVIAGWPISSSPAAEPAVTTGALGKLLLTDMLLPFEFISLILIAALVGAVFFSVRKPAS
jgi:NADH-quinone oxidoreductase subunit J